MTSSSPAPRTPETAAPEALLPQADGEAVRESKGKRVLLWIIAVGIIVPGGYGFIEKFIQFIRTLNTESGGGFTIVPISNYLMVAMGFTCLLGWAIVNGMFRDVEGPKYRMLEREQELDRLEGRNGR